MRSIVAVIFSLLLMMSKSTFANLQYYGGPVISNVKVYAVFWGTEINSDLITDLPKFYQAIVRSNQFGSLAQYDSTVRSVDGRVGTNQHIQNGIFGGTLTIRPHNPSLVLQDLDIQAELEYQITESGLPRPDNNTLYVIHFPKHVLLMVGEQTSCHAFCAYHQGFKSATYGNVYYIAIPDLTAGTCAHTCHMGDSDLDSTTFISSHQVFAAVTNAFPVKSGAPAFPQGWTTGQGDEVGSLCQEPTTLRWRSRNFVVTKIWDNKTSSCMAGPFEAP